MSGQCYFRMTAGGPDGVKTGNVVRGDYFVVEASPTFVFNEVHAANPWLRVSHVVIQGLHMGCREEEVIGRRDDGWYFFLF